MRRMKSMLTPTKTRAKRPRRRRLKWLYKCAGERCVQRVRTRYGARRIANQERFQPFSLCYGLYRWSAVVRGAVDTGCGRNHIRLVPDQVRQTISGEDDEKDWFISVVCGGDAFGRGGSGSGAATGCQ